METTTHQDDNILLYQREGYAHPLIQQYTNFLNKYHSMFKYNTIDFDNYDIRCFLACYIPSKDKRLRGALRRGKYHDAETVAMAHKVLQSLRHKLRHYNDQEVYHELLIPFLHCAKGYRHYGIGFSKYLYKAYKYQLKRHLDSIQWDSLDHSSILYRDITVEEEWELETPDGLTIDMDSFFELSHPQWIHGNQSEAPFSQFKPHERYILVKYYHEGYTDKEIARMLPYNPKSIHRIRMRVVNCLRKQYDEGEIKCLRL